MSVFSPQERAYLEYGGHLGRLATIAPDGSPHIVPVGWRYNADLDTIDVGGRIADEFVATQKFRNVSATGRRAAEYAQHRLWRPTHTTRRTATPPDAPARSLSSPAVARSLSARMVGPLGVHRVVASVPVGGSKWRRWQVGVWGLMP